MKPKVLSSEAWALVRQLVAAGVTEGWTLAGGTGLALQLGHRYSEDLDFFRSGPFDVSRLIDSLSRIGSTTVQSRTEGTLHAVVEALRLSFLEAQAPLLFPSASYRGLAIADPRDIAVMKVVAVGGRGSRKDFVDLFFYLRNGGSFEDAFALLRRRFSNVDYNDYHLMKSLVYFEDAEAEPMPRMLREVSWDEVKKTIVAEVRRISGFA
jgi:hypothetical protein